MSNNISFTIGSPELTTNSVRLSKRTTPLLPNMYFVYGFFQNLIQQDPMNLIYGPPNTFEAICLDGVTLAEGTGQQIDAIMKKISRAIEQNTLEAQIQNKKLVINTHTQ